VKKERCQLCGVELTEAEAIAGYYCGPCDEYLDDLEWREDDEQCPAK